MKPTEVHVAIRDALIDAGVDIDFGPRKDLPKTDGGKVAQCAVMWPQMPAYRRRSNDQRSGREDSGVINCVGSSALDALEVSWAVTEAVDGLLVSEKGRRVVVVGAGVDPAPEPNADPQRVLYPLLYSTVTKG